jgi:hypothetical protein
MVCTASLHGIPSKVDIVHPHLSGDSVHESVILVLWSLHHHPDCMNEAQSTPPWQIPSLLLCRLVEPRPYSSHARMGTWKLSPSCSIAAPPTPRHWCVLQACSGFLSMADAQHRCPSCRDSAHVSVFLDLRQLRLCMNEAQSTPPWMTLSLLLCRVMAQRHYSSHARMGTRTLWPPCSIAAPPTPRRRFVPRACIVSLGVVDIERPHPSCGDTAHYGLFTALQCCMHGVHGIPPWMTVPAQPLCRIMELRL